MHTYWCIFIVMIVLETKCQFYQKINWKMCRKICLKKKMAKPFPLSLPFGLSAQIPPRSLPPPRPRPSRPPPPPSLSLADKRGPLVSSFPSKPPPPSPDSAEPQAASRESPAPTFSLLSPAPRIEVESARAEPPFSSHFFSPRPLSTHASSEKHRKSAAANHRALAGQTKLPPTPFFATTRNA